MRETFQYSAEPVTDIPRGFKMTELGLLPEEWEVVRLGDIVNVFDKMRIPLSENERRNREGVYPYCGANGIIDYIDDYLFDGEYILLAEDGGYWGTNENSAYIMQGKFWVNNHAHVIRAKDELAVNQFLMYVLNYMDISVFISGTTRGKLPQGVMKVLPIPLPPLPEQQAIAYVLRTVQQAKEATERVIQATRELKKSLMRHLFTYGPVPVGEAERVPLKETEIGSVPEHWEVVSLGNIAQVHYGKAKPRTSGRVPVIGSGGVYAWTDQSLVNFPTLIIGRKGTAGQVWLAEQACWPSDTTFFLSWKKPANIMYLYAYFVFNPLSGEHAKTTLPSLQRSELENYLIPLPPLSEQYEIARILQVLDKKLQVEEARKQALEVLFKTLLHNLMTGKIRVNDKS